MPDLIACQAPTWRSCAGYDRTLGSVAVASATQYGIPPHEWQRSVLDDWLALDDDARLLNSLCVLDVPRQNGKTGVCEPRETIGLVVRGERILHTAHEYQTARVGFDRLRAKFGKRKNDPEAAHPELNALVERYTTSANQMILDLKNGAHIEFRTRGGNPDVGRGGTFDLLVIDEAQSYTEEQDASLSSVVSAAPLGSPQTIMMGTIPDPGKPARGKLFLKAVNDLRRNPRHGACLHAWGVDEVGDIHDKRRWYAVNPSLGKQLLESALEADAAKMSEDTFAREHLGWIPKGGVDAVLDSEQWDACKTAAPPEGGVMSCGVKFSLDGKDAVLSVCLRPEDGIPHVEVVKAASTKRGVGWLATWIIERKGLIAQATIDGKAKAAALEKKLRAAKLPKRQVVVTQPSQMAEACSMLEDAVSSGGVTHFGQPRLDESAIKSTKRAIGGSGAWGFDGDDPLPIESCALAHWGAMTTKRNPNKKARVG